MIINQNVLNNPQILQNGMRGGLTVVFRAFAGRDVDTSSYVGLTEEMLDNGYNLDDICPNHQLYDSLDSYYRSANSHLFEDGPTEKMDEVIYTDVNSLYPAV